MGDLNYVLVRSVLCTAGIVWSGKGKAARIIRIFLSESGGAALRKIRRRFPGAKKGRNGGVSFASERIRAFLSGEEASFGSRDIETGPLSEFEDIVFRSAMAIPRGKVISYKGLAALAGAGSARTAGNAMAKNPFPIIVPCHRVVSSSGDPGGFQSGKSLKKRLLEAEGVRFDKRGRILSEFFISYPLNAIR